MSEEPGPARRGGPRRAAVLILLAVAALGACDRYDPVRADALPEEVRRTVREAVDQGHRPSVVLGLANPVGTQVFGYAGDDTTGARRTPDGASIFAIGSVTKAFTGLLLAEMVERGELELAAPVNDYLPDSLSIPAYEGDEMTLLHLATHTSGLPNESPDWDWSSGDIVRFARDFGYERPYGAAYDYSNLGMVLLGTVLERASGRSLRELVAERITGPLGLEDTGYDLTLAQQERLVPAHRVLEPIAPRELRVPESAHAVGGLYSTADDLLRLAAIAAGAEGSDAPPSLAGALRRAELVYAPTDEEGLHAGLGWKIYRDGTTIVHHGGQASGHQAFVAYDPERRVGVALLTGSRAEDDLDRVALHLLLPEIPLPDFSRPPEVPVSGEVLARHAGRYELEGENVFEIGVAGGRLSYRELTADGELVRETTIRPASENEFFFTDIPVTIEFRGAGRGPGATSAARSEELVLRLPDGEYVARRID